MPSQRVGCGAIDATRSAATGVRSTPVPSGNNAARTPLTVFPVSAAGLGPVHDPTLDRVGGVPVDGNCLYWAFGVLLGTYGVNDPATNGIHQMHMPAAAIRNRLAQRIQDPVHWSHHLLHILRLVTDIQQRTVTGANAFVNGPRPANEAQEAAAITHVRDLLVGRGVIPFLGYHVPDNYDQMNAAQKDASSDHPPEAEQRVHDMLAAGEFEDETLEHMQTIVNAYVHTSLTRNGNYAEAFEVELLSEEFGVVIYYYTGRANNPYDPGRDWDRATLTHVMYPSEAVRDALNDPDAATRQAARTAAQTRGFHIARLGLHYYYGMRQRGHPLGDGPMARPWDRPAVADLWMPTGATGAAASDSGSGGGGATAGSQLLSLRRARERAAAGAHADAHAGAPRAGAALTAELHHAHTARKRQLDLGVDGQANPHNPNPGYTGLALAPSGTTAAVGTSSNAVAPPASAAPALLPRLPVPAPSNASTAYGSWLQPVVPLGTMPTTSAPAANRNRSSTPRTRAPASASGFVVPPAQPPVWGSAGGRRLGGYASSELALEALERTFSPTDALMAAALRNARVASGEGGYAASIAPLAVPVEDPRDVDEMGLLLHDDVGIPPMGVAEHEYNNDDIEMELAAIEHFFNGGFDGAGEP